MDFITSRNFKLPDSEGEMDGHWGFNLWRSRLLPYNELSVGNTLYWYETVNGEIVWKTRVEDVDRFSYDTKEAAAARLEARFGRFAREQTYFVNAPESGFCLAYKVKPVQKLSLPKPATFRFPHQGWLRADDQHAEEWLASINVAKAAAVGPSEQQSLSSQASLGKLKPPVLFARIGWMKYYNGPLIGDEKPMGGGKYTKTGLGHEAFNFHEIGGRLFGFFQPQMQALKIRLERVVPGTHEDVLKGVLVVFVATDPEQGSQRIVGWYRNATIYRNPQSSPPSERDSFPYFLVAEAREAVLLPTHLRTYLVPGGKGGFGQANLCYLYEQNGKSKQMKWVPGAIEFVLNYENENLLVNPQAEAAPAVVHSVEEEIERAAGFQPNPEIRKAVELHAMSLAEQEFKNRGYEVKDVSQRRPYDLLCTKADEVKYVEVKGLQSDGLIIVLTPGEVKFIGENKANCVLCVVHGIVVSGNGRPKASGGQLSLAEPFDLADGLLKPLSFTFRRKPSRS
jgi:hypothetical protein